MLHANLPGSNMLICYTLTYQAVRCVSSQNLIQRVVKCLRGSLWPTAVLVCGGSLTLTFWSPRLHEGVQRAEGAPAVAGREGAGAAGPGHGPEGDLWGGGGGQERGEHTVGGGGGGHPTGHLHQRWHQAQTQVIIRQGKSGARHLPQLHARASCIRGGGDVDFVTYSTVLGAR